MLFIVTFITSIPALYLFQPVLDHPVALHRRPRWPEHPHLLGATLELLLIVANVASAVVLFPILRRQDEMLSLGYVTARVIESTFIAIGLVSVLGVVSMQQQDATGAGAGAVGVALAAIKDWTFLLGPGFIVGIGERDTPRLSDVPVGPGAPADGDAGPDRRAPICASGILVLLGVIDEGGPIQGIATIPEFFWELSLGIWLTVRGFEPSPILTPDDVVAG